MRLHHAKRRVGAAGLGLVLLLPPGGALVGCSLLDGWGGLEGGGNGERDAAMAHGDSGDAATMAVIGAACGSTRCDSTKGEGCCFPDGGPGTCVTATSCASSFLLCDDSSECSPQTTCCGTFGTTASSRCEQFCTGAVLCGQGAGTCPSGQPCMQSYGLFPPGTWVCTP